MTPAQQQQYDYLLDQLLLLIRSDGNGGLTSAADLRTYLTELVDQLFADPSVALDSGPQDPSAAQGNVGDYWLNETTGWLWRKYDPASSVGWMKRTLLRGQDSQVAGPKGEQGVQGQQGAQGLNAYQLAVSTGYQGTLTQWLLGLKGADGPNAYQVAVANGYQGTATQWLASLKGAASTVAGPKGEQGVQGKTGADGKQGPAGQTAYQLAVAGGYQGTQAQWLASLAAPGATFPIPANHWGPGYPPVAITTQTDANEYFGGVITKLAGSPSTTTPTDPTTPALTAALAIAVASIVAGNPLTFNVTTNGGGTAPYTYSVVATNTATGATVVLGTSASGSWTPQTPGTYSIDATVTDSSSPVKTGQATTRTLRVDSVANQPPVASAGADTTITQPTSTVQLMGSGSDPDAGDSVTFVWAQVTGPNTAILATPNLQNTTASNLVVGSYQFSLTPTDNHGLAGTKSYVVVHVNAAAVPTLGAPSPTNGVVGSSVTLAGTNLANATGYTFNGVAGPSNGMSSNTATSITLVVPTGATSGSITVTTAGGTATSTSAFTVTAPTNKPKLFLIVGNSIQAYGENTDGSWNKDFSNATTAPRKRVADFFFSRVTSTGAKVIVLGYPGYAWDQWITPGTIPTYDGKGANMQQEFADAVNNNKAAYDITVIAAFGENGYDRLSLQQQLDAAVAGINIIKNLGITKILMMPTVNRKDTYSYTAGGETYLSDKNAFDQYWLTNGPAMGVKVADKSLAPEIYGDDYPDNATYCRDEVHPTTTGNKRQARVMLGGAALFNDFAYGVEAADPVVTPPTSTATLGFTNGSATAAVSATSPSVTTTNLAGNFDATADGTLRLKGEGIIRWVVNEFNSVGQLVGCSGTAYKTQNTYSTKSMPTIYGQPAGGVLNTYRLAQNLNPNNTGPAANGTVYDFHYTYDPNDATKMICQITANAVNCSPPVSVPLDKYYPTFFFNPGGAATAYIVSGDTEANT